MAQHTYDNEAVQELLNWAKKMIETKNYPTERYQVNKCTTIIDGKSYLESLIAMISRNWENPTFILLLSNYGSLGKSGKIKKRSKL
jgi:hypothetical protein